MIIWLKIDRELSFRLSKGLITFVSTFNVRGRDHCKAFKKIEEESLSMSSIPNLGQITALQCTHHDLESIKTGKVSSGWFHQSLSNEFSPARAVIGID
jgi:hypothetical protein